MKKVASFKDYQTFYEMRSDLEDDGYTVESFCDSAFGVFELKVERIGLVPKRMAELGEPFTESENES